MAPVFPLRVSSLRVLLLISIAAVCFGVSLSEPTNSAQRQLKQLNARHFLSSKDTNPILSLSPPSSSSSSSSFSPITSWLKGASSAKPNVLFIVMDDLRPQLGCFGEKFMVTPNIDNFASKSIQFERAYVQQAVCSPSRTSFLTGRRPDSTRVFDLSAYFRKVAGNYTTLPQHFKDNGYITQSVGKIFHPGTASGRDDDYPYSWSNPAYHAPTQSYRNKAVCPGKDGKLHFYAYCPLSDAEMPEGSLPDIQNADYAINFLKERSQDAKPFFLGMGFHKPHLSFRFPKDYLKLYPMSEIQLAPNPFYPPALPEVAWSPWDELFKYEDTHEYNVSFPFGPLPLEYQLKLRQGYYSAVSYADAQVGRVLSALEQYGLQNNTVISFHGDHGWQLGEHGEWCKHTNFEMATRVPMFIYIPGVTDDDARRNDAYSASSSGKSVFPFIDALADVEGSRKRAFVASEKANNNETCGGNNPTGTQTSNSKSKSKLNLHARNKPITTDALVEVVDLFATLSELSGIEVPPVCPPSPFKVPLCTEGASLVPLIKNITEGGRFSGTSALLGKAGLRPLDHVSGSAKAKGLNWKSAVFSQYPRPSDKPGWNSTTPLNSEIHVMGYTMRTAQHRYTEWVAFNPATLTPDWTHVHARELYLEDNDPLENLNVADVKVYQDLVASLSKQLRAGWRGALPPVSEEASTIPRSNIMSKPEVQPVEDPTGPMSNSKPSSARSTSYLSQHSVDEDQPGPREGSSTLSRIVRFDNHVDDDDVIDDHAGDNEIDVDVRIGFH